MDRSSRSRLAGGVVLILFGILLLLTRIFPQLGDILQLDYSWPLIVVGVGVFLFFLALVLSTPDLAVPASIVGGIGLLLYWQNATNNMESWAYAWTLIPGFVGVGVILSGLLKGNLRQEIGHGSNLIFISLAMFVIFAAFLGGLPILGPYWPVVLIILGVILLLRAFSRR